MMHPLWRSLLVIWFVWYTSSIALHVAAFGEIWVRFLLGFDTDVFPFASPLAAIATAVAAYRLTRRKPDST